MRAYIIAQVNLRIINPVGRSRCAALFRKVFRIVIEQGSKVKQDHAEAREGNLFVVYSKA